MLAKTLKFLTNLLFKRVFRGFLTPRKKRKPCGITTCHICFLTFASFNKRQKVCPDSLCIKIYRARQYRARIQFAAGRRKAEIEAVRVRDRKEAAIIIRPDGTEEEE